MQYIYNNEELQKHFDVTMWVCVLDNFNVYKLIQAIAEKLQSSKEDSPYKLVEEGLKSKRFLLVLDDVWTCTDRDEWNRLLLPFTKAQTKGNAIIVTTRFPALAQMVRTTDLCIDLKGLCKKEFEKLFFACAFGDKKPTNDHNELLNIGYKIIEKLKGSPLAAKTVGRLLRNQLDLNHWTRVLESKEWESQNGDHDIMPALKLSFDYLPFHIQQWFTYCALFPEDYRFRPEEVIQFWIGLDVLHSSGKNDRIEDIGLSHLTELVNHGFFKEEGDENGHTCYVIHDLLHELALKISAHECLSICNSNMRSIQILPSIRHLSINIDDSSVKDRKTFDDCKKDIRALGRRLNVENLQSLMLFGKHQGSFVNTYQSLFSTAKALRVILISGEDYSMKDLLHNFSRLIHLRYLRIHHGYLSKQESNSISRFYHLRVLDLQECYGHYVLPKGMNYLINLRHLLVGNGTMHSSISEVGRLESIQELRKFVVEKESKGFELRQIGNLLELGSLSIDNLENVEGMEQAEEAKLVHKKYLHKLTLNWGISRKNKNPTREEQVLEGLRPASNLKELCIKGQGGATCPSWLGVNLSVKNLESLCLDGVAWKMFPPIGELLLVNEVAEKVLSTIPGQHFKNLKVIELIKLARLKKWVVDSTGQMSSHLEVLIIKDCPELVELSFSCSVCSQPKQKTWFPRLKDLIIYDCPRLLSLPPVPWTHALCSVRIEGVGLHFEKLDYREDYKSTLSLEIIGKDASDSAPWKALDFHSLTKLRNLAVKRCPPLLLDHLQMLSSLKTLEISDCNNAFWLAEDGSNVRYQFPVECISISRLGVSGKELMQVLSYMPNLSKLTMSRCEKITELGLAEQKKATSSSNKMEAQIGQYWTQEKSKEGIATIHVIEGLLLLPPQLQELEIRGCPKLRLYPDSLNDDKEAGLSGQGGLQGLFSLRSLDFCDCPELLSSLFMTSSCLPLPSSLQMLRFVRIEGMETLEPFSNLTSLNELQITGCGNLRGEGLWRLLAHGCLTELSVFETPNLFAGSEISQLHEQGLSFHSSNLQLLWTDDITGVLAAPICSLLSSSLTKFILFENKEIQRFTKEQEEALQLLTSLQELRVQFCCELQCLPAELHRLPNLKTLKITCCPAIQSLPKEGLPTSLQKLKISHCPAIRMLDEDRLPYSLRLLDVERGNSEELRRQCRNLIGTIPIVKS